MSFEVLFALPSLQKLAPISERKRRRFPTRANAEEYVRTHAAPFGAEYAIVEGDVATIDALPGMTTPFALLDDDSDLPAVGSARPEYKFVVMARSADGKQTKKVADNDDDFHFVEEAKAKACADFMNKYCAYAKPNERGLAIDLNPQGFRAVVVTIQ
jgi:hypothetical protein